MSFHQDPESHDSLNSLASWKHPARGSHMILVFAFLEVGIPNILGLVTRGSSSRASAGLLLSLLTLDPPGSAFRACEIQAHGPWSPSSRAARHSPCSPAPASELPLFPWPCPGALALARGRTEAQNCSPHCFVNNLITPRP